MSWMPQATEPYAPQSVNKADFQFKYSAKEQPIKPKDELSRAEGKFSGEASSRSDFQAWQTQPRYRHQQPQYQTPQGEMQMRTSYAEEFVQGKAYVKLPPIRPVQQLSEESAKPFEGQSQNSLSFPSYKRAQLSDAKQQSCRPQQQWQAPSQPLDGRSSYHGDFVPAGRDADKAQPVRPKNELSLSTEPLESGTTSKGAYSPTKAERRKPIVPRGELQLSTDAMIANTTQRGDFSPRYQPRQAPIRHSGELQLSHEPFLATSVMKEEFVPRRGDKAAPIRPHGELELSKDKMEAVSTSRAIFTPKARDGEPPRRRPIVNHSVQPLANQVAAS